MMVQRKANKHGKAASHSPGGPAYGKSLSGYLHHSSGGRGLPNYARRRIEPVVGANLDHVRVHDDAAAQDAAQSLNARAFTQGSHIYLGSRQSVDDLALMAHESAHVVQQSPSDIQRKPLLDAPHGMIQKDDDDDSGFNFNLIPPSLLYRNSGFLFDANTSRAQLGYMRDGGGLLAGYQYGGEIFAQGRDQDGIFNPRFGINPSSGVASLGFTGSAGGLRYGMGYNTTGAFSASLGYGAPLLPMPNIFADQAMAAGSALPGLVTAIPSFLDDPMAAYSANSAGIDAVSTFGGTAGRLYSQQQQGQGALPFGAGLTLGYTPQLGFTGMLGVQGSF